MRGVRCLTSRSRSCQRASRTTCPREPRRSTRRPSTPPKSSTVRKIAPTAFPGAQLRKSTRRKRRATGSRRTADSFNRQAQCHLLEGGANFGELRQGEVRRKPILGTSVNKESTSPTLRADVAGAIIVHSLPSFLEGGEHRRSPQSRLLSRSLFRRSRTYTPHAPHPPSPCIFQGTPAHPGRGPPEEGRME